MAWSRHMSRGVDVVTAQEDGRSATPDRDLIDRAMQPGRIVFTRDDDFLREATARLAAGISFASVAYSHQLDASIGECVSDLEVICKAGVPGDLTNSLWYLPF